MHKLGHMVKMGAVYIHVRGAIAYSPSITWQKSLWMAFDKNGHLQKLPFEIEEGASIL